MMRSVCWLELDQDYILTSETELFLQGTPRGYQRVDPFEAIRVVRSRWDHGGRVLGPLRVLMRDVSRNVSQNRIPPRDDEILAHVLRELGGREFLRFPTLVLLRKQRPPISVHFRASMEPPAEPSVPSDERPDDEPAPFHEVDDLIVRLNLDEDELAESTETLRLFSGDRTYDKSRPLAAAGIVEQDYVDIIFHQVPTDLSYSLEITSGGAEPYLLFQDVPFAQLDGLADPPDDDETQDALEPEPEDE